MICSVTITTEIVIFISYGSQIASTMAVGLKMSERLLNISTTDIQRPHCSALVQA
jgi:hypothetical protein